VTGGERKPMAENVPALRAGAGRGVIRFPQAVFPLEEGYTAVHDDPSARVLILEDRERFALVSLELVGIPSDLAGAMKALLTEKAAVPPENIWLSATHSVSTPHLWPAHRSKTPEEQAKRNLMYEASLAAFGQALEQAAGSLREAVFGYGEGVCSANVNRAIPTKDGWWLGSGEEGPVDRSVPVLRFDDAAGEPVAILYNYASELAVMDKSVMTDGGRHVTADLAGAASRFIESEYAGAVALFCPGVSTDQGPAYRARRTVRGRGGSWREVDIGEQGFLLVELLGERLGEQVVAVSESVECRPLTGPLLMDRRTFLFEGQKMTETNSIRPALTWEYISDGEKSSPVEIFLIGDTVLCALGGVGCRTAMAIKDVSPFAHTVIVTSVSGASEQLPNRGQKYMVERDYYDRITFQSRNSGFAAGSAERMLAYMTHYLRELRAAYPANRPEEGN